MAERKGRMTSRAAVLALCAALASMTDLTRGASGQSPFPEKEGLVANGTSMAVSSARLSAEFEERIGGPYALEGLVLVVDDCRPDPEVYLDQALVAYDLAPRAGAMYDDAVAWLVCMEPRFVGFFYASDNPHAGVLDAEDASDAMVSPLRDENFTGAFTASMDVVARQLASTAGGAARPVERPAAATAERDGEGFPWPAALAGAAALGGAAWWWRRRDGHGGDVATRAGASGQREFERRLGQLATRLTPESGAVARLVLAYESMGDEVILEVHRRHQAMVARLAALQTKADQLKSESAAEDEGEDEDESRLREPLQELEALESYVREIEHEADHVESLEANAPVLLVEAREAIAAAREAYGAGAEGFDLPPTDAALSLAVTLADEGEAALTRGSRIEAGRAAEGARDVAAAVGAVTRKLREADAVVDEVALLFPRLERYAESSWADVRGNGSEAEESLDAAVAMLSHMAESEPAAFGPDAAAGFLASLQAVLGEIERARRLTEAVRDRLAFLDRARDQSATSLAALEEEIAAARAWMSQSDVDPDVSALPEDRLAEAESILADTRLAMHGPTPDWIQVMRAINEADRIADAALADARSEREAMVGLRRQVEAARTDAAAALERAERYLAAHGRDVPADAPSRVAAAREALTRAEARAAEAERQEDAARAEALRDAVARYGAARQDASAAYDLMAAAVARAESERRSYVPRGSWMGPFVPLPRGPGPIVIGSRGMFGSEDRPRRKSSWGSRPSGAGSGGRSSSSRRGGGRGW